MKKIFCFLTVFLFIFPIVVHAEDKEYTLFQSTINVNKNKTLDVSETYNVYYSKDTIDIYRILDTELEQVNQDKSKSTIYGKISNVSSDSKYTELLNNKQDNITLNVNAKQDEVGVYQLKYNYNLGKDTTKKNDILYYDIISNLDAQISNLIFEMDIPSKINQDNVQVLIDGKVLSNDEIDLTINDNKIVGFLNIIFEKQQKLSIRVTLPDGYFIGASDNFNYMNQFILIIPFITLLISLIYWLKYRKNNKSINTIDRYDPAEIGYLFYGESNNQDITSIIIYLANEGYLQIIENNDGYKLSKENSFYFVKLKDYDKNNAVQEIIFNSIFNEKDVVEAKDIEYLFLEHFLEAKSMLDNDENKNRIFYKNFEQKKLLPLILIMISVLMMNFNSMYLLVNNYVIAIFISIIEAFSFYFLIKNDKKIVKLICIIISILGTIIGIYMLLTKKNLLIIYIIGMLIIYVATFLIKTISSRTSFGQERYNAIYNFKRYLENLSKDDLKQKIENDSNYFYDMIPYVYVLDCYDDWFNKGNELVKIKPD